MNSIPTIGQEVRVLESHPVSDFHGEIMKVEGILTGEALRNRYDDLSPDPHIFLRRYGGRCYEGFSPDDLEAV